MVGGEEVYVHGSAKIERGRYGYTLLTTKGAYGIFYRMAEQEIRHEEARKATISDGNRGDYGRNWCPRGYIRM
jgi:hypothetical protein